MTSVHLKVSTRLPRLARFPPACSTASGSARRPAASTWPNTNPSTATASALARPYVTRSPPRPAVIVNGHIRPLAPPSTPISPVNSNCPSASPQAQALPPAPLHPSAPSPRPTHHLQDIDLPALQTTVSHNPDLSLTITSVPLGIARLTIPYVWLRDACCAEGSVDSRTGQKRFKSADIPLDIYPTATKLVPNAQSGTLELVLEWSHALPGAPQTPETSRFALADLQHVHAPAHWDAQRHRTNALRQTLWRLPRSTAAHALDSLRARGELFVDYRTLADPDVQRHALGQLNALGLVFFEHVGTDEVELSRLLKVLELDVRRTFYGDLWDVRCEGEKATNVANTALDLGLHMDLLHFENPPRFQLLHCLRNRVEGGASGFVDAYAAVAALAAVRPDALATLVRERVPFEYMNAGHHTAFAHPTVELRPGATPASLAAHPEAAADALWAVNYAPPFQGPLVGTTDVRALVEAFKTFDAISERREMRFEVTLKEGQCVAFDNRRVLHSRTAFRGNSGNVGVARWLKGAYVEGDSVWDRLRVLNSDSTRTTPSHT